MSIKITPALLSDLRQKAEAATIEYDWKLHDDQKNWPVIEFGNRPGEDCGGFTIKGNYSPKLIQDAAHIAAANPAVVLALINQLDWQTAQHIEEIKNCIDLQKIIDDLKKEIEDLKDRCDC
jgi:hypothetical protein